MAAVFVDWLMHLFALDLGFFIDLVMNNLFWIFGFYAAGYLFTGGKHPIRNGIIYVLLAVVSMDMFGLVKFSIYTAGGLGLLYMLRVPLLLFLEKGKGTSKYIPLAWVLSFFFTIAVVAFMV